MLLDSNFWEQRYLTSETGWDVGTISTPLKEYFDTLTDKNSRILIPGAGNAYEAEYLHKKGFQNVTVLDFAPSAIANFKNRIADFPVQNLVCTNFFEHKGNYDLIVEQTFFCALHPQQRVQYAEKMQQLLAKNGKLVGVLFNDNLNNDKPPFGGNTEEYTKLFSNYFTIEKLEDCYNSILPRKGRELFIYYI